METENLPAYCPHCKKTVIIRRRRHGFGLRGLLLFRRPDSKLDLWLCSNCHQPVSEPVGSNEAQLAETGLPQLTESNRRNCPHCAASIGRTLELCPNCQQSLTPLEPLRNVTCHVCGEKLFFRPEHAGRETCCEHCREQVVLPIGEEERTGQPAVIRLPHDPRRPGVRAIRCGHCQTRMTYPERLTGRRVQCTSCRQAFDLP